MTPTYQQDLARAGAETAAQIVSTRSQCEAAREHVRASRAAIQESLDLLSRTARLTRAQP